MPAPRLDQRILAMLAEHAVLPEHRLGIGCSGGPDSAVLAHATLGLRVQGLVGPVTLIHVDHGLRPDSARDADLVRELGNSWNAPTHIIPVQVDRTQASLERAARDARYQAFATAAQTLDLHFILLAHTASDQAETVLMRILRGTGVTGLAAIPPKRGMYLRPLIQTTRPEIEAYAAEHRVPVTRDPMNDDTTFLRTRVRNTWLPALRAENPGIDAALCRLARSAQDQRRILDLAAGLLLDKAAHGTNLAIPALQQAPRPVLARALTMATAAAGAGPLEAAHIAALHHLVHRPDAGTLSIDIPGARVTREYHQLRIHPHRPATPAPIPRSHVSVTGPRPPYLVRHWQPGDRMRPARLKGRSRKLSDLYIDAKVPRTLRPHALIVTRAADGVIEWAEHIGPAWGSTVDVVLTSPDPVASNK